MNLVSYAEPKNIREYGVIYLETLLTAWMERFGVPMDHLESITCECLQLTEPLLSSGLGELPIPDDVPGPMERAFQTAMNYSVQPRDGGPVTEEALTVLCSGMLLALISSFAGVAGVMVPEEYYKKMVEGPHS